MYTYRVTIERRKKTPFQYYKYWNYVQVEFNGKYDFDLGYSFHSRTIKKAEKKILKYMRKLENKRAAYEKANADAGYKFREEGNFGEIDHKLDKFMGTVDE